MATEEHERVISQRDITTGKVLTSVAAVIENEEHKILLIWEGDVPYHDWWVVPGGYVKPDETVQDAIKREVREETGLEVITDGLIGVYDDFDIAGDGDEPVHHVIIAYRTKIVGGEIVVTRESKEYVWMDLKEALRSNRLHKVSKRILGDLNRKMSKTRFRLGKFSQS